MISPVISESPITRKRVGRGGGRGRGEERGNPRDIIIVSYPRHKLAVKYRETIRMLASVLYAFQQEALGTSSEDIPDNGQIMPRSRSPRKKLIERWIESAHDSTRSTSGSFHSLTSEHTRRSLHEISRFKIPFSKSPFRINFSGISGIFTHSHIPRSSLRVFSI